MWFEFAGIDNEIIDSKVGNYQIAKGSGIGTEKDPEYTADGYTFTDSVMVIRGKDTLKLQNNFTIKIWVMLGSQDSNERFIYLKQSL